MREVSIRQFQRHFYTEIKNLPVTVTRRRKKVLVVNSFVIKNWVGTPNSEIKGLKE